MEPAFDYLIGEDPDAWRVRPRRGCIERGDYTVRIKPKAMAVLECLARADGSVVTRDELFEAVWGQAVVSDATLSQCVVELRQAFGDTEKQKRVIGTVPKIGFRLLPEIRTLSRGNGAPPKSPVAPQTEAAADDPVPRRSSLSWRPVALLAVLLTAMAVFWATRGADGPAGPGGEQLETLAVMPFVDMSEAQDLEHFALGLTEELIHSLAQQEKLQVTGRTSSFAFRNLPVAVGEIARTLGVDHILEGSVRADIDRLRITATLIDAESGAPLWTHTYDRDRKDYFEIQEDITKSVTAAMAIEMGLADRGQLWGTSSFEAYEMVMRVYAGNVKEDDPSMMRNLEHLRMATEIDPEYAFAWGALAHMYVMKRHDLSEDWEGISGRYLQKALELGGDRPQIAAIELFRSVALNDWAAAERAADRLDDFYGIVAPERLEILVKVGRGKEAAELAERMALRDPLADYPYIFLQHAYAMLGRTEEALEQSEILWDMWRGIEVAQEGMLTAFTHPEEAVRETWIQRTVTEALDDEPHFAALAEHHQNPEFALGLLRGMEYETHGEHYFGAAWAAHLGDEELALKHMRAAPDPWAFWMPFNAEVRQHPDFKAFVQEIGLVDYWREYGWSDFCHPLGEDDFTCAAGPDTLKDLDQAVARQP